MKKFLLLSLLWLVAAPMAQAAAFGNALVDAADRGVEVLVSNEIRAGVNVNARGDFGVTPLMRAAYNGYTNIMELLINVGADVNAADAGGATALHLAARQGQVEAVKKLISYDAVLDMADSEGFTPLMRATAGRQMEVATLLLKAGADSGVKNEWGDTAMSLAQKRPETASLVALMQSQTAEQEQKLTAVQAIRQNISVPVEQVLPKDLPSGTGTASREVLDQGATLAPAQADVDTELLEQVKLQQKLKDEREARVQAEALAKQAQLARLQREEAAQRLAEAEALAKATEEEAAKQAALAEAEEAERLHQQQLALVKQAAEKKRAQEQAALEAQRREQQELENRRLAIAKERQAIETALQEEREARRRAEAALRAEQAKEEQRRKELDRAAQAPVLPSPKQDVFISEAVPVPLSSGPLVAEAVRENPRPMLLKLSQGVWLQLGPFAQETQAVAYYDKLAQTLADFLPARMKVIATAFLTEAMPSNFLRMGPYTSREVAERACTRFRQGELLCQYVKEDSERRWQRNRL